MVRWVRREAQGGKAETEVRQTRCGAGRRKAEKREDQLGVKVAGERVASEVIEGEEGFL